MQGKDVIQKTPSQNKVVTALEKLLMEAQLEELLKFIQRLGIQVTMTSNIINKPKHRGDKEGFHRCSILVEENLRYMATNGRSMKAAFCSALAQFLVCEEHDFHDYRGLAAPKDFEDQSWVEDKRGI